MNRFLKKDHRREEIDSHRLNKNRLQKSNFVLLSLIGGFSFNVFVMFFYYTGKIEGFVAVNLIQSYITLIFVLGLFFLPYHPKHYGFNKNRLRFNLISGFLIGILGMGAALGGRFYFSKHGYPDFGLYFIPGIFFRRLLFYPMNAFTQEVVTKGYFQSSLIALLKESPFRKYIAIALVSVIFAQFHIIYGIPVVLGCFIFSFLTGLYYEKSRSLIGVYIIHILCGFGLLFFSNVY